MQRLFALLLTLAVITPSSFAMSNHTGPDREQIIRISVLTSLLWLACVFFSISLACFCGWCGSQAPAPAMGSRKSSVNPFFTEDFNEPVPPSGKKDFYERELDLVTPNELNDARSGISGANPNSPGDDEDPEELVF